MAPALSMEYDATYEYMSMPPKKAVILLATESALAGALPFWGAIGCTALGAAFGALVMHVLFHLQGWMAPSKTDAETPLLPEDQSTTCSSGG